MNLLEQIDTPGISLLYAEDDPVARGICSRFIQNKFPDMKLYVANNGKAGLDLYKEHMPDIIITDIDMPIMGGIQMAIEMKAIKAEVTIIAISAASRENCSFNSMKASIDHHIKKPLELQKLYVLIMDVINNNCLKARNEQRV